MNGPYTNIVATIDDMDSVTSLKESTVIPRFTVLLGGKQKCTVNRVKFNTCSIIKHDIGEPKEARYIEGHGKSGPVNRGFTVHLLTNLFNRMNFLPTSAG